MTIYIYKKTSERYEEIKKEKQKKKKKKNIDV